MAPVISLNDSKTRESAIFTWKVLGKSFFDPAGMHHNSRCNTYPNTTTHNASKKESYPCHDGEPHQNSRRKCTKKAKMLTVGAFLHIN
jgi:hypothetical protein